MATQVRDLPRKVLPKRFFEWIDRAGTTPQARQDRANRRIKQVIGLLGFYLVFAYAAAVWTVINVDTLAKYAKGNLLKRTKIETQRGTIEDRNGVTLATSLAANSISANPRQTLPPFKLIDGKKLAATPANMPFDSEEGRAYRTRVTDRIIAALQVDPHFTEKEATYIREQMNRHAVDDQGKPTEKGISFVYLAHKLTDKQSQGIREAIARGELPGVTLEPRFIRYYPNNELAGPLVGRDNTTGSIEASFDKLLRGQEVEIWAYKDGSSQPLYIDGAPDPSVYAGKSLTLTIDEKVQAVAEHHLEAAVREFEAEHGMAVVMDIQTGDVLALAQYPSFNPNDIETAPKYGLHNIAAEFQYEPGSTFKVFNLAIGVQEKATKMDEVFNTGAPLQISGKFINDDHPHPFLTAMECLTVSSNRCHAKIAMRVAREKYESYLRALGFGQRLDLGLIGEGAGQLAKSDKWALIQFANIAFGQGIAVTPLQMVAGFGAVANGGVYRRPRLIRAVESADGKKELLPVDPGKRVFDADVAKQVVTAMATVCQPRTETHLGGTASAARMPNYTIGGKTGTAQQANDKGGGYSDTHWVGSFIGVTPIENPRLVVFAAIDTPKKYDPKLGKIARYGGIVAAPVVREIARFTLPYLGVPPSPGAPYLDRNDPEKAKREDAERKVLARQTVDTMLAQVLPAKAMVDAAPAPEGMARVPDVRRLPMRVVREKLAANKLDLAALGSGVGVSQVPEPGELVAAGTSVQVTFKRLSEVADEPPPAPTPEEAAAAAKPGEPAKPAAAAEPKAPAPKVLPVSAPKAPASGAKAPSPALKERSPSAKEPSSAPQARSSAPKERSPAPEARSPSAKEPSSAPKERSPAPKEASSAPKARAPAPPTAIKAPISPKPAAKPAAAPQAH